MSDSQFFNSCVHNLVELLTEYAYRYYEENKKDCRYVLWSSNRGGVSYVNIAYRDLLASFTVGGEGLYVRELRNIDRSEKQRLEAVLTECIINLSKFETPVSKVEGLLTHREMDIRYWWSGIEEGAIEVYIGV